VIEPDARLPREPFQQARAGFEPTPEVAQPIPGLSLASATRSATELMAVSERCTASPCGWRPRQTHRLKALQKSRRSIASHAARLATFVVGDEHRIAVGRTLDRHVDGRSCCRRRWRFSTKICWRSSRDMCSPTHASNEVEPARRPRAARLKRIGRFGQSCASTARGHNRRSASKKA